MFILIKSIKTRDYLALYYWYLFKNVRKRTLPILFCLPVIYPYVIIYFYNLRTWKTHILNTLFVLSSTYSIFKNFQCSSFSISSSYLRYLAECFSYNSLLTFFVNGSAKFSSDQTNSIWTTPSTIYSLMKWCFTLICFVRPLFFELCAI